jgi:hypothetical protein
MHLHIPLCLIALVATIQTTPITDDNNNNYTNPDRNYDKNKNFLLHDNLQDDQNYKTQSLRHLQRIVDGTVHYIKAARVSYRQRLRDDQCLVEYNGQYLTENSVLQLRKKLYRVEDCLLERVFHACGPNLLLMLNVVCRVVEKHQTTTPIPDIRRQTMPLSRKFNHRLYPRANKTPRVITESCCENLCTLSELTRYCHR